MQEVFQLNFMVRAFMAGGIVGIMCPVLGTFLVLRRLSLIADTLAHVALAGAAIGLLFNRFPVGFALLAAAFASVIIELLRAKRLASDSALALLLYAALALTVVLIGLGRGFNVDLFGYLFGSIVTAGKADIWAIAVLGAAVLALVWLLYGELVLSTFDPDLAKVSGVNVARANMALALLTSVTVTLSMRLVGALLVGALIVFPVLAALQIAHSFRMTLLLAAMLGMASVFIGLTISYYRDIAAGGAIVLVALLALVAILTVRLVVNRIATRPSQ